MKTKGRALPAMLAGNQGWGVYSFPPHLLSDPVGLALSVIGKRHPALKTSDI
jgi:hypothetical protein